MNTAHREIRQEVKIHCIFSLTASSTNWGLFRLFFSLVEVGLNRFGWDSIGPEASILPKPRCVSFGLYETRTNYHPDYVRTGCQKVPDSA